MYATLVLFTHDTRCPYRTMVTLNYTEASPLIKVPSSLLPLLSEFFLPGSTQVPRIRLDTFLCEFNPNHITKLEKLVLTKFKISDRDLEILSEKLTDVQLSKLRIMAEPVAVAEWTACPLTMREVSRQECERPPC